VVIGNVIQCPLISTSPWRNCFCTTISILQIRLIIILSTPVRLKTMMFQKSR